MSDDSTRFRDRSSKPDGDQEPDQVGGAESQSLTRLPIRAGVTPSRLRRCCRQFCASMWTTHPLIHTPRE
jgi:hypothetical protein